jgi:hypothetical protein
MSEEAARCSKSAGAGREEERSQGGQSDDHPARAWPAREPMVTVGGDKGNHNTELRIAFEELARATFIKGRG